MRANYHIGKLLSATAFLILFFSAAAWGQTKRDSTSGDPFKNDPFFSDSIDKIIHGDSTSSHEKTKDFVRDLNDEGIDYHNFMESGPYNSSAIYAVYPNLPMLHYNRVDALFLGLKKERMQWYQDNEFLDIPRIQLHGMLGYSTGRRNWQYIIGMEKLFGEEENVMAGVEFHNATSTDDYWRAGLTETSLTSFFAGYDYLDYYNQKGWGTYILFRTDRLFEAGLAYNDDRYGSLEQNTNWALFGAGNRYRPNPPVDVSEGNMVSSANISALTLSASFNPKRLVLSNNFTFSVTGLAEFADPGIGSSEYDYSRYLTEMVTYINFEPGGVLKYRLRSSSITGTPPLFKQLHLGGIGTLRALPYKSLGAGNQMILSNAELQFGQPLFDSGGWIDFDDFYLSLFLDSGWVKYDTRLESSGNPFTGFDSFSFSDLRHNGGIGLGSSLIRAEVAWDLNNTSRAPVLWLRLNPTF